MDFLLTPFVLIHSISYGQVWYEVNGYDAIGRHHPITIANDNYGYMIAGQDATFSNNLDQVYKYDPILDDWTQIDPFPGGERGYAYGVYKENDAYLGFGSNNTGFPTDWWHFDMSNEQWTELSSFPGTGRNHPAMILANNKISIERVIQNPDHKRKSASIVIITHKALEFRSQNLINSLNSFLRESSSFTLRP